MIFKKKTVWYSENLLLTHPAASYGRLLCLLSDF